MKEKILQDEVMSEDELEQVAGGTDYECEQICDLLPRVMRDYTSQWGVHTHQLEKRSYGEARKWLKDNMGITAIFHHGYGFKWDDVTKNEYFYNGAPCTHEDVVEAIKSYLKTGTFDI